MQEKLRASEYFLPANYNVRATPMLAFAQTR